MISLIQPVAAGNALRIFLEPPAGVDGWRLLRKAADTFTGPDDGDALVVLTEHEKVVLDLAGLVNGTLYYYRPYYRHGTRWTPGATVTSTPNATYEDMGADVLSLVRERLDLGLQEEVRRGTLNNEIGHIKVLTAPPTIDDTVWPVVTVHLGEDSPSDRAIGEMIGTDEFDDGQWLEKEGWLARTQLTIMGWALNPDERIALRKALKRLVQINLPIFDFAGLTQIEFSQQDSEDFGSFGVPVYQVLCTFSCVAVSQVGSRVGAIKEVITTIEVSNEH